MACGPLCSFMLEQCCSNMANAKDLSVCDVVGFFFSRGKIFTWAQQETGVGATSKSFSGCTRGRLVQISPETLRELLFFLKMCCVHAVFSEDLLQRHVNGNAWQFYLDAAQSFWTLFWRGRQGH